MNSLHEKLWKLYNAAIETYEANGKGTWEAGRVDGLKQALELVIEASHE
jgi:hypothetical protein